MGQVLGFAGVQKNYEIYLLSFSTTQLSTRRDSFINPSSNSMYETFVNHLLFNMNYSPLLRMDQSYLLLHDTDFPDIQRFDGTNINTTLSRKSSILYSCTLCFLIPLSNLDVFRRAISISTLG